MAMRPIHRVCRVACIIASALAIGSALAAAQSPTSDTVSAEDLVELGWKHLEPGPQHDRARAIELFQVALAVELDHVPALVGLSNAYRLQVPWDRGDRSGLGSAIAFGLKATDLAPDDPDAHKALGRAYLFKRWYRKALHHFQRQQELRPDADAAYRLGWMGIEMGDYAAVPMEVLEEVTGNLGNLDGKIVVDVSGGLKRVAADGYLELVSDSTKSERIQSRHPTARVVRIHLPSIAFFVDPLLVGAPPTVLIAGNDPRARKAVARMISDVGLDPWDAGPPRFFRVF